MCFFGWGGAVFLLDILIYEVRRINLIYERKLLQILQE